MFHNKIYCIIFVKQQRERHFRNHGTVSQPFAFRFNAKTTNTDDSDLHNGNPPEDFTL